MNKSLVFGMGMGLKISSNIKEKVMRFPLQRRLEKLLTVVSRVRKLTIVLHNNPDPDAIAAGAALKFLLEKKAGVEADIVYQGVIGRAENKALVEYLDVPLTQLADENPELPENLALVDTHPESKNNPLPEGKVPLIVIDHHNNFVGNKALFSDIRPSVGATSTIMTEYLQAAGCRPSRKLATALLYGIKTDTMALSRNTTSSDVNAYCNLSALADIDAFLSFEKAQVSAGYFQGLAAAMEGARVYKDGLVITYLKELPYPDLVAEIADLMLRLEGSRCVIAFGLYDKKLHFSVRTLDESINVNKLALAVAGQAGNAGGRETIAGGQIPLNNDPEKLVEESKERILQFFNLSPQTEGELLT